MDGRGPGSREALGLAVAVLLTRLGILALLHLLTGGEEFADDVSLHASFIDDPLALLAGRRPEVAQYPPLLPLLLWLAARPFRWLASDFVALRLGHIAVEAALAFVVARLLHPIVRDGRARRAAAIAWVLLPSGWMTSAVMAEDEVWPALFLAVSLLLAARGRERPALLVLGLGIAASKILLAVPALALVACLRRDRALVRAALALGPAAAIYGAVYAAPLARGAGLPLAAFTPDVAVNVNVWALSDRLGLDAATAKPIAAAATLAAVLALLALVARTATGLRSRLALVAASLLWVFVLAYHVNPEYYLLAMPPLVFLLASPAGRAFLVVLTALPWAVNTFFGLAVLERYGGNPGKQTVFALYRRWIGIDPVTAHVVVLAACMAVTLGAAMVVSRMAKGGKEGKGEGGVARGGGRG